MPYPELDLSIYGAAETIRPGPEHQLRGVRLPTVVVPPGRLPPLTRSFEEVAERLQELPGIDFEPDGAFVGAGQTSAGAWQLQGMLYDRGDQVQWCEFRGTVPQQPWKSIVKCLSQPDEQLIAFLPLEQIVVSLEALDPLWQFSPDTAIES